MEINRITAQGQGTLEEFYGHLASHERTNPHYREIGVRMLELLPYLRAINGPPIWALTSHEILVLVSDDECHTRLMTIQHCGYGQSGSFKIQYPMPTDEAPWPGAEVVLGTHDLAQASEMVAYGLCKATGTVFKVGKVV
jgi:hypothetical protein